MLADFLLTLVSEPDELEKFVQNPEEYIRSSKLSQVESQTILNGNLEEIRELLGHESRVLSENYDVHQSPGTPHCPVKQSLYLEEAGAIGEPSRVWSMEGLTVVGAGIRSGLQTTMESLVCIKQSAKVLYLMADHLSGLWIERMSKCAESLQPYYKAGMSRLEIYDQMVDKIIADLQEYRSLCLVLYGHPAVFVYPARRSIQLARSKGFAARMLPGVSSDANLFSDLMVDPGMLGMQSYEATSFLIYKHPFDTCAGLLLWQVAVLGDSEWPPNEMKHRNRLEVLSEYLAGFYGYDYEVVLYQAAELPFGTATVERVSLANLPNARSRNATLYVPPKQVRQPDLAMMKKLDMVETAIAVRK